MENIKYDFLEEYNKLNTAQKQAVETIDGPVLVIAGPGTGKTQILAARVGNILNRTDALAENILCLTYTEAGVTAMRKRLIKFIGAEAYKVNIHTFHSFCNRVIQENTDLFGFGEMDAISELEEIELFEKLIDGFANDNLLKRFRGEIYYDISRLKNLFSMMKKENISVEKIEKAIDEYIDSLPEDPKFICGRKTVNDKGTFLKGDVRTDKIEEERKKFDLSIAAAHEFETYQKLKQEANKYDFDDMILNVLEQFQKNEYLLSRYQEQFLYFLVDEYQDTNGSQNEILRLLFSFWEKPNVFVVGDDDQSIYRFQGASLSNILDFYDQNLAILPEAEQAERIIVLKQNYRSTQEILNVAATTIKENNERLIHQIKAVTLDKNLTASGDVAIGNTALPKVITYPNASQETADIANQIIALHKQGVNLKEIGVLYSQHKQSEDIQQCLNQKDIPVSTRKKVDILSSRMTNMLLDIMTYIAEENRIPHSREDLLFNMMLYPFFEIKAIQVARLSFELRENRYKKPKTTWREVLENIEVIFDEKSIDEIKMIAKLTNKWQKDLQELPLQLLFQTILDDISCITYIQNHKEKVWLLQELKTFFDFIKTENQKNTNLSLNGFLDIITQHRNYGIDIPFVKSTYSENAVQLTTIHGSKGLEYKYVFLMGLNSNLWESKRATNFGFSLPENLIQKVAKESKDEELRRLFFVAITRAEKYLQISNYSQDEKGKDLTPSVFLETLKDNKNIVFEERKLEDDEVFEFNVLQLMKEKIAPELIEQNMLKKRLETYTMSVTHLNNYLECPLKFYYQNFIQIPQAKNGSMAFGSAVHDSVEILFKQMLANENIFPTVEEFVEFGRRQMYKQQDSFTKKEYDQKIAYIEMFYPEYYNKYVAEWNKEVKLEEKLEAVYEDINLTGKLDKIEFDKNNIAIIDYKTGQWKPEKQKLFRAPTDTPKKPEEPTFEETNGGNYWRQAVFYKILVDNSIRPYQRDWSLVKTEFDFVEPNAKTGEFHKEKVVISANDVSIVKKQIKETLQKINDLNFEGCGKEDCAVCQGVYLKEEDLEEN